MTSRQLFLDACQNKLSKGIPVWFMRQAGRYLPEYQAYKKKYNFVEMVHSPDIATEITLQPIRRYDMDAAILYCDILVISECFGLDFEFEQGIGPRLKQQDLSVEQIADRLSNEADDTALTFVYDTISQLQPELSALDKAFIGFCGSPFTVMLYLLEKGSSKDYSTFHALKKEKPELLHGILDSLTKASARYLKNQIKKGVDAVQIFDTWASLLNDEEYQRFSFPYIKQIVDDVSTLGVPVIVFSKNMTHSSEHLSTLPLHVLGVDWESDIVAIKKQYPHLAVQGNLNPQYLLDDIEQATAYTRQLKTQLSGTPGFIFNLGHGILQHTPLDNVQAVIDCIRDA